MDGPRVEAGNRFQRRLAVETPEHVVLEFELAGVGSRAAAAVYDTLVLVLLILAALMASAAAGLLGPRFGTWYLAILVAVVFVITWGYYVLSEGLWNGRTLGKRDMGIRVVMDTGHPVTFAAAAIRNLVRLVDAQPGVTYLVGGLFVFFHPQHRRLGDLVAGTIVVRDRPETQQLAAAHPPEEALLLAGPPQLTDDEYRLLAQFLGRRADLEPALRGRLGAELASRFALRYPHRPRGQETFLVWLHAEETKRHQRPGRVPVAQRFVARKQASWERFRSLAVRAEREGLRRFSGAAIPAFAASYREVAADLARARTYGVDARVVAYLERIVSAGHNALYGLGGVRRIPFGRLLLSDLPGAVVRARAYVLAACLLFALPAAAGYIMIRERPALASQVLPDEMIARAEEGAANRAEGAGYAQYPSPYLPLVASSIVANNVQVAIAAFAFGITAGIGTVVVLTFNGLFFGAILGLFVNYRLAGWLLSFVAGHGVLELAAIFMAGGAGLLVARALVAPGDLTRRDALVVYGRTAVRLVGAATCLLLLAGTIEGFLSASDAPPAIKLGVSAASAVLLALYYAAGRRPGASSPRSEPRGQLPSTLDRL
jgi:uncharacterized membrane protein SpoIIM required for sporulation/uncharacterized RDD family membrane protein YckC